MSGPPTLSLRPSFGSGSAVPSRPPSRSRSSERVSASAARHARAAVSFNSLAQSFAQLRDVLDNPHEHNITPQEMGDLLDYLSPRLLETLRSFHPPSRKSTEVLASGKLQSSFAATGAAAAEKPTQVLHEEWKKIIEEFSTAMELDAVQAYHILETYLHLYHPSAGHSAASSRTGDNGAVTLPELIHHYYTERSSLLQCVAALFRIYLDNAHAYHAESATILKKLVGLGLEEQILERFKECAERKITGSLSSSGSSGVGHSLLHHSHHKPASTLFHDSPELASKCADQVVTEQALLLEILFLQYYDLDEFLAHADSQAEGASAAAGQKRIVKLYTVLQSTQFGRLQPLYTFLSAKGRATVNWIGHLCVLLGLEVMSFEKLMRVYNHPLQDMKAFIQQSHLLAAQGGITAQDDEDYTRNRNAATLLLQDSDLTFREHPFSDLGFLAKLDQSFFEHSWNPKAVGAAAVPALAGPLNLGWAIALSHVYEFLEDCNGIRQEYGLAGIDEDSGRSILDLEEFSTERQIIIQRLEASMNCGPNPFQLLASILAAIQQRSTHGVDHMSANLPAFKEIVHELLSALFESSCYSALSSLGPAPLAPLFPLFNLIFHEDAALCYRFWSNDEKHPQDRSPLFEQAIALFPSDPSPFIHLLTALAGRTADTPLKFGPTGEAYDTHAATADADADSRVCATRCFESLLNMKTYSSIQPPEQILRSLDPSEEFNLQLSIGWTSPDGVQLPAETFGRFVAGTGLNGEPRLVQWWHSYSAWPLLISRVEHSWKLIRSSVPLSAREWLETSNILQLLSKLVKADAGLYVQLIAHLSGSNTETALALYDANASFSSGAAATRELSFLVLLMRIQAFVSLHAPAILASTNTSAKAQQQSAAQMLNQSVNGSNRMETTFEANNLSAILATTSAVQLTAPQLLTLLEACSSLLFAAAKNDLQCWLKAFTLVAGQEMSLAGSLLYASASASSLLSNISPHLSNTPAQPSYNYVQMLHRSLASLQGPQGRYVAHATFLEHVSTLVWPLYDMASIQNLRLHARPMQPRGFQGLGGAFAASTSSSTSTAASVLAINTSVSAFLTTFDLHQLLKYVCESVFVQYDEWQYASRSERWTLGSHILRFFLLVLSTPSAPPIINNNGAAGAAAAASPLHTISLQQYLYTLFLTEPSMLLSLLRPLLLGLSLLDRLNYDRTNELEIGLLHDLLAHTFLVLDRLMNLEGQRATVATVAGSTKPASFYQVLLETVSAAHAPAAWRYTSRRRGGQFSSTPTSLLHAMTAYANYTRSAELQSLAIQTIRLLCANGGQASPNSANLATHFQPDTLQQFRSTCLQLLTAHSTELSLKTQLLQLLATMFERQPAMAQVFASTLVDSGDGAQDEEEEEEEDDSLFQLLKAYVLTAEDNFAGDAQSLHLILRIILAVWQQAASTSIGLSGDFVELQSRLRKEVPHFWEKITHCLTAEIQEAPSNDDSSMDAASGAGWSSESSTLSYFLSIKLLRNCVWSLINLELFTAFFAAPQRTGAIAGSAPTIDAGLEAILTSWANSSTSPHRYIQFLLGYAHCSENVSLHKQCLEQLQQYGVDLALFLTLPSIAEQEDGTSTPLYNLELLTEVLQLDLNVAFERERNGMEQQQQQQQYGQLSRYGADDSTALMLRESSSVDATSHRQRIEHLLLSLKKVNNSLLIADSELTLLKSWRTFVQLCLQKQPALLGIKHKSALGWEYIQTLAQIMVAEKRLGDGEIISVHLQHVSSLLLAFLSSSLVEGSGSGAGSLASAILIGISRSQQRNNQPQMDLDERVAGESVFRATNELLSNVASILHAALKAYVSPQAANPLSQGIVPALVGNLAGASAARSINFDATARITQSWLAARVTSVAPAFSSPVAGTPSPAVTFVQNLSTSTLLLMRWSNQLLMTTLSRPTASLVPPNRPTTSPLLLPAPHPGRLTSPPPVRRLDGSFASPPPTVGTSLPPVLEAQKSLSNTKLIQATGQEYAATCHSLLQAISGCLAQPLLADSAITIVPLLLQAIDLVQGVAEFRDRHSVGKEEILHDEEPIDAALSLLRPMLPTLLHYFASIPLSQPLIAQKVVQLLCVIAQYEHGAEMLVQHSIMLAICTHRVFKPSAVMDSASSATATSNGFDDGRYHPSFSPYTPSRTRDAWHQVWVLCLSLIGTLLRSTAAKSTGSIGSASLPPLSSPTHTKLVEEVLGFFNLFSGPRLNKVLHLSHVSHLSIGSLEEIDALTHLLYEFEKCARMWHPANPALHATQKAQLLLIFTYYLRLLNDPRELEKRILIVTAEEKADAEDAPESEEGEEKPKSNTDFAAAGVPITRNASLVLEEGRGVPIERQKSEAALAAEKLLDDKRKAWKPLGGSSGMPLGGSGSSTPTRQLSTPTTPRSSSTPVHKGVSDEEKSAEPPGSGRMGVNTLLTPARNSSSLLLSSPVVHQLVRRIEQTDQAEPTIGTGFITGALAADSNHASSQRAGEREKGFAFFSQRIEFSMCLILRNCVSYLRLVSTDNPDTSVRQALFSHKIKVVNLGSGSSMLPPSLSSQATQGAQAGAMWMANGLHTGAPHSAHVGLTSAERIQQIFTGLGVGIEEDAQQTALQAEFEADYYELESNGNGYNHGSSSSKAFRPPLSMLVDFQQYLVRVLSRLFEIQQSNGLCDTLDDGRSLSADAFDASIMRTRLPNSSALLSSTSSSSASFASLSLHSPSIPTIHRVMSFLLENTLLLLVHAVQMHVTQLKKTQRAYLQLIMPPTAQQQQQAQQQQNIYSYGGYQQQDASSAAPPPVHPGAIRVGKLLEAYRERLTQLSELLVRYLTLLSSHAPSPPSLTSSTASSSASARSAAVSRSSRLVVHLCEMIDELTVGLARHAVAFHRFITQPQQQQQQQQQGQMQQGQYAMQH